MSKLKAAFTVPSSLDKKGGRRFHLLLRKRWHRIPPFLSNEPGTAFIASNDEFMAKAWVISPNFTV
jgi:hypothetical protein